MMRPAFPFAVLAFCAGALPSSAQSVSTHDISQIRLARDVRLSPDARSVAFVVSEPADSERATRRSGIWTIATGVSDGAHLLISGGDDSSPRWSPDGKTLAFLSVRGDASPHASEPARQIHRLRMEGDGTAAPEVLTSVAGGVDEFAWSPDGRFIAFTATEPAVEEDPVVVDRNLRYTRLGILDVSERTASLVTGREFDVQELAWSPKGDEIALVVAPSPRPADQVRLALVVVTRRTGRIDRRLSENVAMPGVLRWSPDGRFITFLECPPTREFASWLAMVPAAGGRSQPLVENRLLTVLRAEWTPDSRRLVLLTIEGTRQNLRMLDVQRDRLETIADVVASQADFGFTTDGATIAYLSQTPRSPTDVWVVRPGTSPRKLTDLNPQTAGWRLGAVRSVSWKNTKDGRTRSGVLVTPPNFEADRPYPTIVQGHPGDLPWWTGWLASWWAWGQLLASNGYVVFLPNYRGVTGEGWKMHATLGDWGSMAFQDLMDGVDALVEQKIADPERLGIGGWSNGGFMTEWAITHTTRFKAAVALAGHSDFFSLAGTSSGRAWLEVSFGDPYTNRAAYEDHSPITFIRNCRTPTLVLHGENDSGVPIGQGYEFYTGLKVIGVESELVVYPREGHSIQERGHQEDLQRRVLAWFDRHLKETARPATKARTP